MDQKIRFVVNKNGSMTVYVPAKFADRFEQVFQSGVTDLIESEMDDEEAEQWTFNATYEYK